MKRIDVPSSELVHGDVVYTANHVLVEIDEIWQVSPGVWSFRGRDLVSGLPVVWEGNAGTLWTVTRD